MNKDCQKRGRRKMTEEEKSKTLSDRMNTYKKEGKVCSCCHKKKDFDDFFSSDKRPIFSWCKECDKYKVKVGVWKRKGEKKFNESVKKQIEQLKELLKIGKELNFTSGIDSGIFEVTKIRKS